MKKVITGIAFLFFALAAYSFPNITLYRGEWKMKFMDNVFYEKNINTDIKTDINSETSGIYRKIKGNDIYDKDGKYLGRIEIKNGYIYITYFYSDVSENAVNKENLKVSEITEFYGKTGRATKLTKFNADGSVYSLCDYKAKTLTLFNPDGSVSSVISM